MKEGGAYDGNPQSIHRCQPWVKETRIYLLQSCAQDKPSCGAIINQTRNRGDQRSWLDSERRRWDIGNAHKKDRAIAQVLRGPLVVDREWAGSSARSPRELHHGSRKMMNANWEGLYFWPGYSGDGPLQSRAKLFVKSSMAKTRALETVWTTNISTQTPPPIRQVRTICLADEKTDCQ